MGKRGVAGDRHAAIAAYAPRSSPPAARLARARRRGGHEGGASSARAAPLPTALALLAAAMLAACKPGDGADAGNRIDAVAQARADIWCARDAAPLARACTLDRAGDAVTIRFPDGGFRRLTVTQGTIVPADGAEIAREQAAGADRVDIAIGRDHLRLGLHGDRIVP